MAPLVSAGATGKASGGGVPGDSGAEGGTGRRVRHQGSRERRR